VFFILQFSNLLGYQFVCCFVVNHQPPAKAMLIQTMDHWSNQYVTDEHGVYSKFCSVWRHNSSRDVSTVYISPQNIHTVQHALEII